jgi:putative alpha-1,2-mannosidase
MTIIRSGESNGTFPGRASLTYTRDTYRTLQPLYHLLYTETYSRVLKGLISIFTNEGYYPAGRSANWNGRVQGGTHADMVMADAYVKNKGELHDDIDWQEAYRGMIKDADVLPIHNVDTAAFDGANKEGRGALDDYLRLHFITRNHSRSLSRGVEYSQNDFAIYSVARSLSDVSYTDVDRFLERASWWQNQWSSEANTSLSIPSLSNSTSNTTFTGFVAARNSDGNWNYTGYDPLSCNGCGWQNDIYEAKVWETSFSAAPHDMAKIIELMGGDDKFVERLDVSFLPGFGTSVGANNDAGSALFNPGKLTRVSS